MGTKGRDAESSPGMGGSAREEFVRDGRMSQDLVAQVADKVYAMLLLELKIEKERRRLLPRGPFDGQGGWW